LFWHLYRFDVSLVTSRVRDALRESVDVARFKIQKFVSILTPCTWRRKMKVTSRVLWMMLLAVALATGCPKPEESTSNGDGATADATDGADGEEHGHSHAGDDALIWQREGLEHEGYVIALGHHGAQLYADHEAEPAVMVTKDGEAVADAKVFVTLLNATGDTVVTEEQATVYEPETPEEPAHYAQAEVKLPADATEVTLRYRIELPGASEFTQDVVVPATKH
jgi:hypothetical protein